jgi:pimeloyl-ACP methyl ester carboxylesterase
MAITSPGVSYEVIGSLSASELTTLLADQFTAFNTPIRQSLAPPALTRGATLYRVFYTINVESSKFSAPQVVSGLLMLPEGGVMQGQPIEDLPLVIYNHGTLFGREQTASNAVVMDGGKWSVGSAETLFNIGLLAEQGYALIAPDYVGYGVNFIDEAYGVKKPTTTAIVGLLEASRSVLSTLGVRPSQLFLNGWSQGGLNTQWATQRLETLNIPVAAVAVQSPFNELEETARWWLSRTMADPRLPLDPGPWVPLCVGILLKSYESWYGLEGLVDAIVKDEVIPAGIDSFGFPVTNPEAVTYREIIRLFAQEGDKAVRFGPPDVFSNDQWQVLVTRNGQPIWTTIPGFAGQSMLVDGALDQPEGVVRRFLDQLESDSPRYWKYSTPLKAWYGLSDEALPPDLVAPGMGVEGGEKVTLVPVVDASHRQTFLNALLASQDNPGGTSENLINWFASFRKQDAVTPSLVLSGNYLQVVSEDFGFLSISLQTTAQQGERPLHIQVLRTRQDGSSEVIGSLGGTSGAASQLQSLGNERFLLQVGEKLGFQLLARSGDGIDTSSTEIRARPQGGGFDVTLRDADGSQPASLQFAVVTDPLDRTLSPLDRIAAPQGGVSDGLLQLRQGQGLKLQITTDCAFENRLGFVRLNLDPITGQPLDTIGDQGIAIGSSQFREQIDSLLDPGFRITQGGRMVSPTLEWNVRHDGIYAPVLITPEGNIFCSGSGNASTIGNQQMRRLGENHFGFEDMKGQPADYDFNDMVVKFL